MLSTSRQLCVVVLTTQRHFSARGIAKCYNNVGQGQALTFDPKAFDAQGLQPFSVWWLCFKDDFHVRVSSRIETNVILAKHSQQLVLATDPAIAYLTSFLSLFVAGGVLSDLRQLHLPRSCLCPPGVQVSSMCCLCPPSVWVPVLEQMVKVGTTCF